MLTVVGRMRAAAVCCTLAAMTGCTSPSPVHPSGSTTPPLVRVSADDRTQLPANDLDRTDEDTAWVVAAPNYDPPPAPPSDIASCGDLHRWEHAHGAIDMGGTQLMVSLWAPRADVTVEILLVIAHVVRRQEPFETQAIECSPDADVPQQSELLSGGVDYYDPNDTTTPTLDAHPDGAAYLKAPSEAFHLMRGDTDWFTVSAQATDGWYDWELEVRMEVNGIPTTAMVDDSGSRPFSTNSGFRGTWVHSSAYVWCVGDTHPHLGVQKVPFLCPEGD